MFLQQRATHDSALSYLFGCAGHGLAIAVDVVSGDEPWFIRQAHAAGVRIAYVVDTHLHADHYSGGVELARLAGAQYAMHESAGGHVSVPFLPLADAHRLRAGNVVADVLHTPGHTEDSLCLVVRDLRRGDAPWFAITGDTLFVGAVGRPDLAGREREMAGRLYDSLHGKLFGLPPELEIYPGHQAGSACGAGLSGKPASTLAFERRFNPMLSLPKDRFVAELLASVPAQPRDMARILEANRFGAGAPQAPQ